MTNSSSYSIQLRNQSSLSNAIQLLSTGCMRRSTFLPLRLIRNEGPYNYAILNSSLNLSHNSDGPGTGPDSHHPTRPTQGGRRENKKRYDRSRRYSTEYPGDLHF